MQASARKSGFPEDDTLSEHADAILATEKREYMVIGKVRVPLIHILSRSNGIDEDFPILDELN
jgi:hypothetical protein